jgi:hypothetical protein
VGPRRAGHASPLYSQWLALKLVGQWQSISRYSSLADQKAVEFGGSSCRQLHVDIPDRPTCDESALEQNRIVVIGRLVLRSYIIDVYSRVRGRRSDYEPRAPQSVVTKPCSCRPVQNKPRFRDTATSGVK